MSSQIAIYKEHSKELLDENEKILPATAEIYKKLAPKLNEMTTKAIQLSVVKNAEEIFGKKPGKELVTAGDIDSDPDICSEDVSGVTISIKISECDQFNSI